MAVVTLGEAARLPGLGKTTLARAIELARVYPFPAPAADTTVKPTGPTAPPATPTTMVAYLSSKPVAISRASQISESRKQSSRR
jgi:hypothetical protein